MKYKCDVLVVGAGIAGIAAAVKASREGVKVILLEMNAFPGGMATAGMVSPFMKHEVNGDILVRGVFEDLENKMRTMDGMVDNGFYASAFRMAAWELLQESGVELLLDSFITSVSLKGRKIQTLEVKGPDEIITIEARQFIDCSGDAQLLHLAGLPTEKGEKLQALTLFFRMTDIDMKKVLDDVAERPDNFFPWCDKVYRPGKIHSVAGYFQEVQQAIKEGELHPDVEYIFFTGLAREGEGAFNTSNILGLDGSLSADLTRAEYIGRLQVDQVVQLLRSGIKGFENARLLETAPQVGVRETRRAIADYVVAGDDIRRGRKFDDAVARGCYGIDIHGQKDEESVMEDLPEGEYYEVPYSALPVKGADNVQAAGRCISGTREGQGALRIMPTSAATGEAAGAAAAIAVKRGLTLRNIPYDELRKLIGHNLSMENSEKAAKMHTNSGIPTPGSGLQSPDSGLQSPVSGFQSSDSGLQPPVSGFPSSSSPIIFGTDGWRGLLDSEMHAESVMSVAAAFSRYILAKKEGQPGRIAIAYDGRRRSEEFARLTARVLSAAGHEAVLADRMTATPVLSYFVKYGKYDAGIMITASHNPAEYNGIKFKSSYGGPFMTEDTAEVEAFLDDKLPPLSEDFRSCDMFPPYLEHISSFIDLQRIAASGIRVAVDSMHAAGGDILMNFLNGKGIKATAVDAEALADFGGRSPEPIEANLGPLMKVLQDDPGHAIGLATDGDADRLGVLREDGSWLTAHESILLLTEHMLNYRKTPGTIVKSASVTEKLAFLSSVEHPLEEVQVGFKYICEAMIDHAVAIGCEESGGYGFAGHIPERDGLLSALLLMEAMAVNKCRNISQLLEQKQAIWDGPVDYFRVDQHFDGSDRLSLLPELAKDPAKLKIPFKIRKTQTYNSSRGIINGLKFFLEDRRWLLLRSSETEPLIRIYAEGRKAGEAEKLVRRSLDLIGRG